MGTRYWAKSPKKLIRWVRGSIFFLSRSNTISSIFLAVGNTPYGKRHISRTKLGNPLQSIFEESSRSRQSFWVLLSNQFDAFFNQKNTSDTNATNNTPPTWKTYELSRHQCCLALNFGEICQPLTFRPMPAPKDREARATQRRFTGLGLQKDQRTSTALRDANTIRRTFSSSTFKLKQRLGSMAAFFQDGLQRIYKFGWGDMPLSVWRGSYRSITLETA